MQTPPEQLKNEHVEPGEQASVQLPAEQLTLHVAPGGHDVLQYPLEQLIVHVPLPQ
jgi:hypothetical protein